MYFTGKFMICRGINVNKNKTHGFSFSVLTTIKISIRGIEYVCTLLFIMFYCYIIYSFTTIRHATARGSIPGGNSVFTELRVLRKGQ